MAEQKQDDQLEPTYTICEDTGCSPEDLSEAMNDREEWWGREREPGISVLAARHDDDDDIYIYIYIYIRTLFLNKHFSQTSVVGKSDFNSHTVPLYSGLILDWA